MKKTTRPISQMKPPNSGASPAEKYDKTKFDCVKLGDADARAALNLQKAILSLQNQSHQLKQELQVKLAQIGQAEQGAQKQYTELVAKLQSQYGCVNLMLDPNELYFLKPKSVQDSAAAGRPS